MIARCDAAFFPAVVRGVGDIFDREARSDRLIEASEVVRDPYEKVDERKHRQQRAADTARLLDLRSLIDRTSHGVWISDRETEHYHKGRNSLGISAGELLLFVCCMRHFGPVDLMRTRSPLHAQRWRTLKFQLRQPRSRGDLFPDAEKIGAITVLEFAGISAVLAVFTIAALEVGPEPLFQRLRTAGTDAYNN